MDYQTYEKLDPAYYEAALKLGSPGNKFSDIVKTRFGYHIVKLTGVRKWEDTDKAKVKRLLIEQRQQKVFEDYMAKLRSSAKVTLNSAVLKE